MDERTKKDLRGLKDESGMGDLILMSYDRLADGGRARKTTRKMDADTEVALRRLFDLDANGKNSEQTATAPTVRGSSSRK